MRGSRWPWTRRSPPPPPLPRPERPRSTASVLLAILGVVLLFYFVGALLFSARTTNGPAPVAAAWSSPSPPHLFRHVTVPEVYVDLVTVGEPPWVATARADLSAAAAELDAHLGGLRTRVLVLAERGALAELPTFEPAPLANDDPTVVRLRGELGRLAQQQGDPARARQRLHEHERLSLLLAAQQLERTDLGDRKKLEQGKRLQQFLADTTGCRVIPLVDDPALDREALRAANRNVARLWMWCVNEVANTEAAWQVFGNLRGRLGSLGGR